MARQYLYGLWRDFDGAQTNKALRSIFKYNFKPSMRGEYNPCRVYSLNDEGRLVICAWPQSARKPIIPLPYSQETQNGYEYAAATKMIQNGLVEEGMTAVKAIRERYDGYKRNPSEINLRLAVTMHVRWRLMDCFRRFRALN